MAKDGLTVELDKKEFLDALEMLKDMEESIDEKYVKATLRRKLKPMERRMKRDSHSARLATHAIGITTAKKKTPLIKVGVVKNDASVFEDISSYGLAAILEYGTPERFRAAKKLGVVTGKISTGRILPRKYAWLRSAWDKEVNQFEKDSLDTIVKKVEKAAK